MCLCGSVIGLWPSRDGTQVSPAQKKARAGMVITTSVHTAVLSRDGMLDTEILSFINFKCSKPEMKGYFVFVENKS